MDSPDSPWFLVSASPQWAFPSGTALPTPTVSGAAPRGLGCEAGQPNSALIQAWLTGGMKIQGPDMTKSVLENRHSI